MDEVGAECSGVVHPVDCVREIRPGGNPEAHRQRRSLQVRIHQDAAPRSRTMPCQCQGDFGSTRSARRPGDRDERVDRAASLRCRFDQADLPEDRISWQVVGQNEVGTGFAEPRGCRTITNRVDAHDAQTGSHPGPDPCRRRPRRLRSHHDDVQIRGAIQHLVGQKGAQHQPNCGGVARRRYQPCFPLASREDGRHPQRHRARRTRSSSAACVAASRRCASERSTAISRATVPSSKVPAAAVAEMIRTSAASRLDPA